MKDALRVSVRALAEFCTEGGDLVRTGNAMERMREGMLGHQALQSAYGEGWEREVSLSMDIETDGLTLRLYGRADGLSRSTQPPVIEEIKTTERPVDSISADDVPAHWAQAMLYGAMLTANEGFEQVALRLTYMNLTGGRVSFTRTFTAAQLAEKTHEFAAPYVRWLRTILGWQALSRPTMQKLPFPFSSYRAGQREMAANVYIALRDKKRLLCEAPTGIGKTAAALYPALKALSEQKIDRVFFLTARTTGQLAADDALENMRRRGLIARSVVLNAREKMCVQPELPCSPDTCPRARGYYDRRRKALYEASGLQQLNAEAIQALAEKHCLCPFELELDLAEIADVVICDYNYVFDPRVRLQRFFTGKSDAGILIDEAHNLCPRARDMLSATLCQRDFRDLRTQVGKASGRKHPVYRALSGLLEAFKQLSPSLQEEEARADCPESFVSSALEAAAALGEWTGSPEPWSAALTDGFFALTDFVRTADGYTEDYRTLISPDGKTMVSITLWCVNPAPAIDKALSRVHGAALFSATLSPMPFYRDVTGLSEEAGDALLSLPSPYPPDNLLVMRAPLPVRYKQREQTLPALAQLLHAFISARRGNYMLFFPSYAYLQQAKEALLPLLSDDIRLIAQSREMDDDARAAFLNEFQPDPDHTLAGMAVLGGAFAEGVDLPDDRLIGAAIVGTGVPQLCLANDTLKSVYAERFSNGYAYAYQYPGVARALQAAGRVIRSETDRGAVLLIDQRWTDADHTRLLPSHWRVHTVPGAAALSALSAGFWEKTNENRPNEP